MRKLLFALLTVLMLTGMSLPFATPVYAADETIRPSGAGALTQHWLGGSAPAATNWESVDEAAADDGVTLVWVGSGYYDGIAIDTYDFPDFTADHTSISSVTLYLRHKKTGYAQLSYPAVRISGTNYFADYHYATDSWSTVSRSWNTNPATGNPWTKSDINNAEFGMKSVAFCSFGGTVANCTQVYIVVTYTPATSPTVTTQAVTGIAGTSATGNGNVTSDGGSAITERGICWNTTGTPTTADSKATSAGTTGAYTATITPLVKNTRYYVRAYAINAIGTSYGSEVNFRTLADPSVTTLAATDVVSTTAKVNASVTDDGKEGGGEACTVKFAYKSNAGAPYASYAAIVAAGGTEVTATGTYTTGQFPYYELSGLTVSTTYNFATKITNSVSSQYGSVLSFTTESGVYTPTNFTATPGSTTVSLLWTKGVGASNTLVRYSTSTYPATISDGTLCYLGTGNSVQLTDLTPGTTYWVSAWGLTAGVYSASKATTLATTVAYGADTGSAIEVPPTNSSWSQTPSAAKVSSLPLAGGLVANISTAYGTPENSLWYLLVIVFATGLGIVIYVRTSNNLPASLFSASVILASGAALGLTMLWIMVAVLVIASGFIMFGERR